MLLDINNINKYSSRLKSQHNINTQVNSKSSTTNSLVYLTSKINNAEEGTDLKLTIDNSVRNKRKLVDKQQDFSLRCHNMGR